MKYVYGMRLRGFSPGCQPSGVIEWEDVDKVATGFWSIITYGRELSVDEVERYDLTFIKAIN